MSELLAEESTRQGAATCSGEQIEKLFVKHSFIVSLARYQKFEYAIGHWLQKATEHMLGCVLCR